MQKFSETSFFHFFYFFDNNVLNFFSQYRMKQQLIDMKLKPQQLEMERTLMLLQERDTGGIFSDPVKADEVFYLTLLGQVYYPDLTYYFCKLISVAGSILGKLTEKVFSGSINCHTN